MKQEPHIPTLVGLLILLVGVGSTIFLIENGTALFSRATADTAPKNVTVVNVTDTTLTVSWLTHAPTRGSIQYQERTPLVTSQTAFDIRDQGGKISARYTHFISISGLKPQTAYEITIVSGQKAFTQDRLTTTTGATLPPPTHVLDPAFGTLFDSQNQPVTEALVYTSFSGSQMLGTIIDPDGSWVISLGSLRAADGTRYFLPTAGEKEQLLFISNEGEATATTNVENDSPLPPVRLGETADFTRLQSRRLPVIAQAQTFSSLTSLASGPFQVLLPEPDATIPSGKPAFKGKGIPGKKVIITISGAVAPVVGKVTVAPNGTWTWTPPALPPGAYLTTIVSFTEDGSPLTVSRAFSLLKSGTSVLQAATPSATLAPSPSPVVSPGASPQVSPKPSVTPRVSALPSVTATPGATASPGASPPPVTGTSEPTVAILILGVSILLFGVIGFATKNSA